MTINDGRIMNNFFDENRYQYSIPVYQRNYEWSKDQCKKLFEDILYAGKNQKTHFIGSIVYAPIGEKNNIKNYVIIDGQQRFTTIYILLKALYDTTSDVKTKDALESSLFNKDKYNEMTLDSKTKLKLKPIKSDNNQLLLLMENKEDKIDKSSGIWINYDYFSDLIINELKKDKDLDTKTISNGIDNLICARIELDKNDNAQEIFDRINSTGIPLSLADKIRNYVLMTDADQENLFENYWLEIENLIKKEQRNAFFLDYLNMKLESKVYEKDAYDIFKNHIGPKFNTNQEMLSELLYYARFYNCFLYGTDKYGQTIKFVLQSLQKLKQTTLFVFLFKIFDDFEKKVFSQQEFERILKFLLNYSIRRLVCDIPSNSLNGLYKTLYNRLFRNENNKQHYYDTLVCFFSKLTSRDALPSDEDFCAGIKQKDIYKNGQLCKLLLTQIENQGKEILVTENLTIEHIMPQNKNLSKEWQYMLGENWYDLWTKYLHTLGNLTLTGYNSELGDRPFEEKKDLLEAKKSKILILNESINSCSKWTENEIMERAEALSEILQKLFKVDKPDNDISFSDPSYHDFTCDNPENATYKTLASFDFEGNTINVNNFSDLFRNFVKLLYERNNSIIEELAKSDDADNAIAVLFSYDKGKSNESEKISDSDIYLNFHKSAKDIMLAVRQLLDLYEIDRNSFTYNAKDSRVKNI